MPCGPCFLSPVQSKSSLIIKIHCGKSLRLSRQRQNPPRLYGNAESGGSAICGGVTPGGDSGQVSLSVPRLQLVLRGGQWTEARILFPGCSSSGAVPLTPGQAKAARRREMGHLSVPSPGPQKLHSTLQATAVLPTPSCMQGCHTHSPQLSMPAPAPCSSCLAQASHPSALPAITRAPNGVLVHLILQQHGDEPIAGLCQAMSPSPSRTG